MNDFDDCSWHYGKHGDKGCDGYRKSTGDVFACYEAQNGAAGKLSTLINMINEDFGKALKDLDGIMLRWNMTHNIIEGMPADAVLAFNALEKNNQNIEFVICGHQHIRELFDQLSESQRAIFLEPHARNVDYLNLQINEVKDLVDNIIAAVDGSSPKSDPISPVSPE